MTTRRAPVGDLTGRRLNVSPSKRMRRIALGVAAIEAGTVLLLSAGPALAVALGVLLVLTGVYLTVTGAASTVPSMPSGIAGGLARGAESADAADVTETSARRPGGQP